MADAAEEDVELDVAGEGLAAFERERPERRGLVERGKGFGLSQGESFQKGGG
jgi:hypothetical protein